MVILISGASHTGKTALAQKILKSRGFPYLSIDHLKMGLIRSGYSDLTPESDDGSLTRMLWPVVREIIKTAIENGQNLTVEGCYIPPDWSGDFDDGYLKKIIYRCLVMSERYILNHFDAVMTYANIIERRLYDECIKEQLIADNKRYLDECRLNGLSYILIDDAYPDEADFVRSLGI